jgi:hypothetical protein
MRRVNEAERRDGVVQRGGATGGAASVAEIVG